MFKFDNSHIFTGYLKQYLHDFNLPKYSNGKWFVDNYYIYNQRILNKTKNLEIKNNRYDYYTHEYLGDFLRFQRDFNNIDLMPLYNCFNNRICTHLLLNFGSAIKDSSGLTIKEHRILFDSTDTNYKIYMVPVHLNAKYTIAIDCNIPLEICCGIFGKYLDTTVAADISTKYANSSDLINQIIATKTYTKYNSSIFSCPELYDLQTIISTASEKLDQTILAYLQAHESDLKLFIKVPINNTSSITILEGDYRHFNDTIFQKSLEHSELECFGPTNSFVKQKTKPDLDTGYVFWIETDSDNNPKNLIALYRKTLNNDNVYVWTEIKRYSQGTILKSNENECKPNEYWYGKTSESNDTSGLYKKVAASTYYVRQTNSYTTNYDENFTALPKEKFITDQSKLEDRDFKPITPLQLLRANTQESYPFADRLIEYLLGNVIDNNDTIKNNVLRAQAIIKDNNMSMKFNVPGAWDAKMRPILYDFMQTEYQNNKTGTLLNTFEINHDILGYVDKDVEHYYYAKTGGDNDNPIYTTIENCTETIVKESGIDPSYKGGNW